MADNQEPEQKQQGKRRFSMFTIFFVILLIGLPALFIINMCSNITVIQLSVTDFESRLNNEKIFFTRLATAPYQQLVYVEGEYVNFNNPEKAEKVSFTTTYSTADYVDLKYVEVSLDTITNFKTFTTTKTLSLSERLRDEIRVSKETPVSVWQNVFTGPNIQSNFYFTGNDGRIVPTFWDTLMSYIPMLILVLLGIGLAYSILTSMARQANRGNDQAMSFNNSRARRVTKSRIRFTDVAGCDEEKAELVEVVDYLKNPKRFTDFGAKLPRGILLIGSPGTGKTLLAKATAGEAGVPFFSISGSDFVEMFVGVGAGRVRDMFKKAKASAPCIVFIDEIDAVGRQRGAGLGGGNDEREQTLNQLLVEMDGFSDNSGVVIIAATNREDVLDPALLRAGRFDRQITVNLPDKEGREAIFHVHARGKRFNSAVDFKQLAGRTVGFSGADIENILNEAAILAVRQNKEDINMADIDEAIDRRIAGPAKKTRGISEKEKRNTAYHEAGHAIIGLKLPGATRVLKVTIVPRGRAAGYVLLAPEEDYHAQTKRELIARIVAALGGRSSEEIFFDDVTTGAVQDIEQATRIARAMVTRLGMSSLGPIQYEQNTDSVFLGRDYASSQKNFSAAVADQIDQEVRKIIDEAHAEAHRIILENRDELILIANALLERETLTAEDIDALLKKDEEVAIPEKKISKPKAPAKKKAVVSEGSEAPKTIRKPRTPRAKKE